MRCLQDTARVVLALWLALAPVKAWAGSTLLLGAGGAVVSGQPMVSPVFVDTNNTGPSATAANYIGFNGGTFNATQTNRESIFSIAGTVGNLRANFATATGASATYDICLVKNGSGTCTSLTCQITNSATSCNNNSGVSVVAGDFLAWKVCPSNAGGCAAGSAPAASTAVQIAATITSTANGEGVLATPFLAASSSTSVPQYTMLGSSSGWDAIEANVSAIVPTAGTIDNLYVYQGGTAPGAAKSIAFTLYKNGSPTSLTCTLSGAGSGAGITFCSDTTVGHAVSVTASDTISVQASPTGTPGVGFQSFSTRWVPTIPGEAFVPTLVAAPATGSVRYFSAGGRSNSGAELSNLAIAPVAFTWKKLFAAEDVVPGGTGTRTMLNRKGTGAGQSSGTITCQITSAATSCSDTNNTYSASAGDFMNWQETPANTPATLVYFKYSSVFATQ